MNLRKFVIIRTTFSAIHRWMDCPYPDVSFLRNPHRHVFHVEMKFVICHYNRDIEFIRKKNEVTNFLQDTYEGRDIGDLSCEMLAGILLNKFNAYSVFVSEDNENGALIETQTEL